MKIRLQKYLPPLTNNSRRQIEELIRTKQITINNRLAKLGDKADDNDEIKINNQKINPIKDKKLYLILHKPAGYTCTKRRFKNEKNIYELLPEKYHHLNSIGRLDKDSEGLLLLTNDGDYLYQTTHPKFAVEKEYLVEVDRKLDQKILAEFENGLNIGLNKKELVNCKKIKFLSPTKFSIIITQGKNRQIRRMCQIAGLKVLKLTRIREGKVKLDNLKAGQVKLFLI